MTKISLQCIKLTKPDQVKVGLFLKLEGHVYIQEVPSPPPEVLPVKRECTPSLFLLILLGYASHRRASDQRTRKCD